MLTIYTPWAQDDIDALDGERARLIAARAQRMQRESDARRAEKQAPCAPQKKEARKDEIIRSWKIVQASFFAHDEGHALVQIDPRSYEGPPTGLQEIEIEAEGVQSDGFTVFRTCVWEQKDSDYVVDVWRDGKEFCIPLRLAGGPPFEMTLDDAKLLLVTALRRYSIER